MRPFAHATRELRIGKRVSVSPPCARRTRTPNLPVEPRHRVAALALSSDLSRYWSNVTLVPFLRARCSMRGVGNRFVYILRSNSDSQHHYVGITSDVDQRLEWHNHGPCGWTVDHRPWSVVVTIEFPSEHEAVRFEKYLKSGSGRAFTKRHFAAMPDSQN